MREITIQIPDLEPDQKVEIEVRINGKTRIMQYRVELVEWEKPDTSSNDKVIRLREKIKENEEWELVQFGSETQNNMQVLFRKRPSLN